FRPGLRGATPQRLSERRARGRAGRGCGENREGTEDARSHSDRPSVRPTTEPPRGLQEPRRAGGGAFSGEAKGGGGGGDADGGSLAEATRVPRTGERRPPDARRGKDLWQAGADGDPTGLPS